MDEYLRDAAVYLGVSQFVLENEYYMIDIIDVLDEKRRKTALDQLVALQVQNADKLEEKEYKKYVNGLIKDAGIKQTEEKFSRSAMDELHAFASGM